MTFQKCRYPCEKWFFSIFPRSLTFSSLSLQFLLIRLDIINHLRCDCHKFTRQRFSASSSPRHQVHGSNLSIRKRPNTTVAFSATCNVAPVSQCRARESRRRCNIYFMLPWFLCRPEQIWFTQFGCESERKSERAERSTFPLSHSHILFFLPHKRPR